MCEVFVECRGAVVATAVSDETVEGRMGVSGDVVMLGEECD